jgi:hypothetical protein
VGGRSAWIAWPAAVFCTVVVGVLVWLAAPGVPGAISFVGDTLRSATTLPEAAAEEPIEPATDCRSLYPDRLWAEMTWTPEVLLDQDAAPPATTTTLTQALAPTVLFTCTWRTDAGPWVSTTFSQVAEGSGAVAQAALSTEGFSCQAEGDGVHCERTSGGVTELNDVRGGGWLSTVLSDWQPEDYGTQTASRAFPG